MFRTATTGVVVAILAVGTLLLPQPAGAGVSTMAPVPLQEDPTPGLRVTSRQFVTVDLDASVLRVRYEVDLRNETPNRTSGSFVEQFYFTSFSVPVFQGASAMAAKRSNGTPLPVDVETDESGLFAIATVDLRPDLFFGQSESLVVTYELPTQPPRSGAIAQVNSALATFPLIASGDPGATDIEVRVPARYEIEVVGDGLDRTEEAGVAVLRADAIADPTQWFATVLVRSDGALSRQEVSYGLHTVTVLAWPGDDEWLDFTVDLADRGFPALEGVIGQGLGMPRSITIVESVTPYVYGFAGWYQGSGAYADIEVGDQLDGHVTLHEMAHAWFNDTAFDSRWMNEAFADETAALAMVDLGIERPVPEPASTDQPGAVPLTTWSDPDLQNPESEDQEAYGYNTSWWIAHQIAQEVGEDRFSALLVAAGEGRSAYDPAPEDDAANAGDDEGDEVLDLGVIDWRELLDLAEDVGGSTNATALWQEFVLAGDDLALLDARNLGRQEYAALVEVGDGWLPPRVLRDEMARWEFDDAAELGGEVQELYERRDALDAQYEDLGIEELPESLEAEFEDAEELDEIDARFDEVDAAVDAVNDADEAITDLGPLARVGLWFEDPSEQVEEASAALETGSYSQAERLAESASQAADDAARDGALRLAGLTGVILLAGYGVHRLRVHRRRPQSF